MIEYENAPDAVVRCGEADVAGRRVAAAAVPYSVSTGESRYHLDVVTRRILPNRKAGVVSAGPSDAAAWERAIRRCPAGPVVVGPNAPAEEIRGAYAAAAGGAARAGRAVYLLDPGPAALAGIEGGAFVVLVSWTPADPEWEARLAAAGKKGGATGAVLPIVPGWTDEPEFVERWIERATAGGARFTVPIALEGEGEVRRLLVEARTEAEPGAADRFFQHVHHCDWAFETRRGVAVFREHAARRGIPTIPPRPVGSSEPPGNAAAAARLEERAVDLEDDEHRAALLHAAARWIDESARDLGAVVREGNFARVFPYPSLAAEAEAAFEEARRP